MRTNFRQMDDHEGSVASNGQLKFKLEAGPTYDVLALSTANVDTPADHAFVVEVDGDERVRMSLQELLDREAYEGNAATSGFFFFSFVDLMARTIEGENIGGMVTKPGSRVYVTIELGTVDADETFTLYAQTSDARQEEIILRCIQEQIPITKAGLNPFTGFDEGRAPGHITIRKMFLYSSQITKVSLERDDRFLYGKRELPIAANSALVKRAGKTVPSNCFVLDPVRQGNVISDPVDTFNQKEFRLNITTSGTTDVTGVVEYVEDLRAIRQAA